MARLILKILENSVVVCTIINEKIFVWNYLQYLYIIYFGGYKGILSSIEKDSHAKISSIVVIYFDCPDTFNQIYFLNNK